MYICSELYLLYLLLWNNSIWQQHQHSVTNKFRLTLYAYMYTSFILNNMDQWNVHILSVTFCFQQMVYCNQAYQQHKLFTIKLIIHCHPLPIHWHTICQIGRTASDWSWRGNSTYIIRVQYFELLEFTWHKT